MGHTDWHHGAPHNSWAPIIMSAGFAIFLFTLGGAYEWGEFVSTSYALMIFVSLAVIGLGILIWWRQDFSFDGSYEPKSFGAPYQNIDIRKVAVWVFLMSEMMVFSHHYSVLTSDIVQELKTVKQFFESGNWVEGTAVTCFEPASHLIASSWFHLAPGAINTFALIISSFTIVQALRYAKKKDLDENTRRRKVTMFLGTTWLLAILFLTLKMIEWFIGFPTPGPLTELNLLAILK